MSLVPAISHSFTLKEYDEIRERTATSMRISFLVTIPFSVILYVMAEPIVTFIYNAPAATDATRAVAIAICFLGLHQISTAILQGLKKPKIPVINMAVACVAKVLCNWFLVAIRPWASPGLPMRQWPTSASLPSSTCSSFTVKSVTSSTSKSS